MTNQEIDLAQLQKMAQVNRQVINRLKERVSNLETALALTSGDQQMAWLYRNRSERMDATVPIFPADRARFHMARYQFAAEHAAEKTVADVACGTGYGVRHLLTEGRAAQVTGVDICDKAIDYAREKHSVNTATTFVCADAVATGLFDNSFDLITSFETIEHVTDDVALIKEFARLLKPGGRLICSTPNQWPLEIAPHHLRVYDLEAFRNVLEGPLVVEHVYSQNSGSDFKYNHGQPAGIVPATDENQVTAECFIAIALLPG